MNSYNSCYMCSECQNKIIGDWYQSKNHLGLICLECKIKENIIMPNIKITTEVDGKIVPLNTISTESFEAIKALEKPKEIPVARWATCSSEPRLLFKPVYDMVFKNGKIYALNLKDGTLACEWFPKADEGIVASQYQRVTSQL